MNSSGLAERRHLGKSPALRAGGWTPNPRNGDYALIDSGAQALPWLSGCAPAGSLQHPRFRPEGLLQLMDGEPRDDVPTEGHAREHSHPRP